MIRVLSAGAQSLVVDLGRPGLRHFGVPLSGAADRLSHQVANWIVGNRAAAGTLECALGGLSVEAGSDCTVAVCGAEAGIAVNDRPEAPWRAIRLAAGDQLTLEPTSLGARCYLAVAGGIEGERHFGSLSTYTSARLGANGGRALASGDRLDIGERTAEPRTLPAGFRPRIGNHVVLRVRSVAEYERLSAEAQRRLFVRPWTASSATSRMGARLGDETGGGILALSDTRAMISSPLLPGTLQVPPDGRPILSLVDGHCTGGYVRAVQVIAPDMWLAGQIGPGTRVSFTRAFADAVPEVTEKHVALWRGLIPDYSL